MMDIAIRPGDRVTVVAITGSVDGLTAERVQTALEEAIRGDRVRLVVDGSGMTYTSSAGLRAVLAAVKQARTKGGDVRLAAVTPPVHRVLELAGFTSILKLYPDVASATASFAG